VRAHAVGERGVRHVARLLLLAAALIPISCHDSDDRLTVTVWHQMPSKLRALLEEQIALFEAQHPDVQVRALYKETEELRSGYQAAVLAGIGPDLVYGPSDVLDPYHKMGIVRDMSPWFGPDERSRYVDGALTSLPARDGSGRSELLQVGDRVGNHLALVYNRAYIDEPPQTTDDLVRLAIENTVDTDGDGRIDRYGLVWNYTEPFFLIPFLTGHGAWPLLEESSGDGNVTTVPNLDRPEVVAALRFVLALRDEHRVVPANCDYEAADSLFKTGKAAMIINGDWEWGSYLALEGLDAAIAPLPTVAATGTPMGPMVAPMGYSLNPSSESPVAETAIELVKFLTSPEVERRFMEKLRTLPSRRELLDDPLLKSDPTLAASAVQIQNGVPMPVVAELRAFWDGTRPHYQALVNGSVTPEEAAAQMQRDTLAKIELMNQELHPGPTAIVVQALGVALLIAFAVWQRRSVGRFLRDWRRNRLAYLFVLPSLALLFVTIVFPFFYNVVLSLSNMSLLNFRDWQVVGLDNYAEVFQETQFLPVLLKTIVWTAVNVFFHVSIGLLLAVAINGPVFGKSVYRILLIIPWAVPAYITALTWRGMFDYEYGAVNLMITEYLSMPMVNWLGEPFEAFSACILTNVWLGFPFMMVIALGGMQGIPRELYEAARVDGASRPSQFFHITLPLLKPVLVPAVTLGAIWTFNNLNVVWLVSNGGEPSDKTHILVSYVYKAVFNMYRYGYGAALSMVIFFILLAFSLVFLRRTRATGSAY